MTVIAAARLQCRWVSWVSNDRVSSPTVTSVMDTAPPIRKGNVLFSLPASVWNSVALLNCNSPQVSLAHLFGVSGIQLCFQGFARFFGMPSPASQLSRMSENNIRL